MSDTTFDTHDTDKSTDDDPLRRIVRMDPAADGGGAT
jgi:hypothetical protein